MGYIESESTIITEPIQIGLGSWHPKELEKFAQWLGFNSNLEILVETVALEKLRMLGRLNIAWI